MTPSSADRSLARRPSRDGRAFLSVAWHTLAGLAGLPGHLSRIGPITAETARALAAAAMHDSGCQWRLVLAGHTGRALAVTAIPRSWLPQPGGRPGDPVEPPVAAAAGGAAGTEPLREPGLFARVTITLPVTAVDRSGGSDPAAWPCAPGLRSVLTGALGAAARAAAHLRTDDAPAASGGCSHRLRGTGYRIPGSLRALVEARDQTCRFPTCNQPAWLCDQDHTHPYHRGGRTCACNLAAACRHHHRLKQTPAWQLTQPRPGTLIWRTPAGLTYTTTAGPHLP